MAEFEDKLATVVTREIAGCESLVRAERLSGGASQETYRLTLKIDGAETTMAMRRTPGGLWIDEPIPERPGLAVEAKLMQAARDVGVPEPEVFYVLRREDDLGEGFIMQWLEGEALGARIVRSEQFENLRPQLAEKCGRALARIHSIDLESTGLDQDLAQITPSQFVTQMWDRYKAYETPQPMIDYAARWLNEHLPAEYVMRLVHNDFRNGNFMVSPDDIVAVLDWEVAHIGDPMRDLGWICTNSWRFHSVLPVGGFGEYEDLFRGYEAESGKTVNPDHVKFWEVFGSYWWAVGCLGMAEHYRNGPDKTVERPAIGRRTSECQVDCVNLIIPGPVELVEGAIDDSPDMPRADELVKSVRDYLHNDVMAGTQGRLNFMSRVAGNSLDIVLRELELGPAHRAAELDRLQQYFGSRDGLLALRWRMTNGLRDGSIGLDDEAVKDYLRNTVVNQIAIDQPRYTGFKRAIGEIQ